MDNKVNLQEQIDSLRQNLEHVAEMIVAKGTLDPGPAEDELPLRDRVEDLEREIESLKRRLDQKA